MVMSVMHYGIYKIRPSDVRNALRNHYGTITDITTPHGFRRTRLRYVANLNVKFLQIALVVRWDPIYNDVLVSLKSTNPK